MPTKKFSFLRQLCVTLSVSLVLLVAGLAWGVITWQADAWVSFGIDTISDRYIPGIGSTERGNLFIKSKHQGNIVNKTISDAGEDDHIVGVFSWGVAWWNNGQPADVDRATVDTAGGETDFTTTSTLYPDDWELLSTKFVQHGIENVAHADIDDYWGGGYTTTGFRKRVADLDSMHSNQIKAWSGRPAPTGTKNNVQFVRVPHTGWGLLNAPN